MAPFIQPYSADDRPDPRVLRAMLETCRLDLGNARRDVHRGADGCVGQAAQGDVGQGDLGQSELEQSLCRVVERLERTAGTLDAMLDRVTKQPSAMAAAEVLAREADHRIKNSLQTVISLMEQQAMRAKVDGLRDALHQAAARVEAVAQVHATLHAAPASYGIVPELSLDKYLGSLCAALARAMDADDGRRSVEVEVEPLAAAPATAQQLGLIVTELATNALRHAFRPGQPGTVRVTGAPQGDGTYRLCVADDGRGLPPGFDIRQRPSGLGLRVVNVLADQLRARLTVDGHAGARFTLALPASVTGLRGGDSISSPI